MSLFPTVYPPVLPPVFSPTDPLLAVFMSGGSHSVPPSFASQPSFSKLAFLAGESITWNQGAATGTAPITLTDALRVNGTLVANVSGNYTAQAADAGLTLNLTETASNAIGSATARVNATVGYWRLFDGANTTTFASATDANGSALTAESIATVPAGINATESGVLSGAGNLTITGGGNLTLTAANTYTGTTAVSGGHLIVGAGSTTGALGADVVTITAPGELVFNRSNAHTVANSFAGNGTINMTGTTAQDLSLYGATFGNFTGTLVTTNGLYMRLNATSSDLSQAWVVNNKGIACSQTNTVYHIGALGGVGQFAYGGGNGLGVVWEVGSLNQNATYKGTFATTTSGSPIFRKIGTGTQKMGLIACSGGVQVNGGTLIVNTTATGNLVMINGPVVANSSLVIEGVNGSLATIGTGITGTGDVSVTIGRAQAPAGDINISGNFSLTQLGTPSALYGNGYYCVNANNRVTAKNINFTADCGKTSSVGNNLWFNTVASGGDITLNASFAKGGVWFGMANIDVQAGTGNVNWVGTCTATNPVTNGMYMQGRTFNVSANYTFGATQYINCVEASLWSGTIGGGAFPLVKRGAGELTISSSNLHTGGILIEAGNVSLTNANAAGTGNITLNASTVLKLNNLTIANNLTYLNGATAAQVIP